MFNWVSQFLTTVKQLGKKKWMNVCACSRHQWLSHHRQISFLLFGVKIPSFGHFCAVKKDILWRIIWEKSLWDIVKTSRKVDSRRRRNVGKLIKNYQKKILVKKRSLTSHLTPICRNSETVEELSWNNGRFKQSSRHLKERWRDCASLSCKWNEEIWAKTEKNFAILAKSWKGIAALE